MNLVEIDVVRLQPAQAGLHRIHNMSARGAHIVAPRTNAPVDFRGDDHVLACNIQILERLAQHFFALAVGIHIRGVEEIHARLDARFDQSVRPGLIHIADMLPDPCFRPSRLAAESHGAKTNSGNE